MSKWMDGIEGYIKTDRLMDGGKMDGLINK